MVVPREIHCTSAKEFIDTLRLSNDDWHTKPYWHSDWIFRGQSDAEWPLMASAWRNNDKSQSGKIMQHHRDFDWTHLKIRLELVLREAWQEESPENDDPQSAWRKTLHVLLQAYAEVKSIYAFISISDEVGHPIEEINLPDPDQFIKRYIMDLKDGNSQIWNSDIVAIARHHGMPSRLLDWTQNPLIAAFLLRMECTTNSKRIIELPCLHIMQVRSTRESRLNQFENTRVHTFTLNLQCSHSIMAQINGTSNMKSGLVLTMQYILILWNL